LFDLLFDSENGDSTRRHSQTVLFMLAALGTSGSTS
jgi:hypothetical protein